MPAPATDNAPQSGVPSELDPRRCRACNYPLIGLSEPRCPECGTRFDPNEPYFPETPLFLLPDGRPAGYFHLLWMSYFQPTRLGRGLRPDRIRARAFVWLSALWVAILASLCGMTLDSGLFAAGGALWIGIAALVGARCCEWSWSSALIISAPPPRHDEPKGRPSIWSVLLKMGAGHQAVTLTAATLIGVGVPVFDTSWVDRFQPQGFWLCLAVGYVWWAAAVLRMIAGRVPAEGSWGGAISGLLLGTIAGIAVAVFAMLLIAYVVLMPLYM